MYGIEQMANIFTAQGRDQEKHPATASFDKVAQCTVHELGSTLRATYRAADRVQRGIVDMAALLFFPFLMGRNRSSDQRNQAERASERSAATGTYGSEPRPITDVVFPPEGKAYRRI